jgi:hypothetical protein
MLSAGGVVSPPRAVRRLELKVSQEMQQAVTDAQNHGKHDVRFD